MPVRGRQPQRKPQGCKPNGSSTTNKSSSSSSSGGNCTKNCQQLPMVGKSKKCHCNGCTNNMTTRQFDAMVDYNASFVSNGERYYTPFKKLCPPSKSCICREYWQDGDVTASVKGKIPITLTQYAEYCPISYKGRKPRLIKKHIPKRSELNGGWWRCNGKANGYPVNGACNPLSISKGTYTDPFGVKKFKTASEGQPLAIFDTIGVGLMAGMIFLVDAYNARNIAQMNNRHQGYFLNDCSGMCDFVGMAALRLRHVEHVSRKSQLNVNDCLDLYHLPTLCNYANAIAEMENQITFSQEYFLLILQKLRDSSFAKKILKIGNFYDASGIINY